MAEADAAKARPWLQIARNDLESAKLLAGAPEAGRGPAVYHCQQAAEKAVKAFLVAHDQPFEKIHDIERLIMQAALLNQDFAQFAHAGAQLTPLGTAYRYPEAVGFAEPQPAKVDEALRQAEAIYNFVLNILAPETHP